MIKNYVSRQVPARGIEWDGRNEAGLRELLADKLLAPYDHPRLGPVAVVRDTRGSLYSVRVRDIVLVPDDQPDTLSINPAEGTRYWDETDPAVSRRVVKPYLSRQVPARGTQWDGRNEAELHELIPDALLAVYAHPQLGQVAVVRDSRGNPFPVQAGYTVLVPDGQPEDICINSPEGARRWEEKEPGTAR